MWARRIMFTAGWLFLTACQPQVLYVEITPASPEALSGPVTVPAPAMVAAEEVTRIVRTEVTRIVAEEVIVEVTPSPLGSAERPIQLMFPPVVDTAVIAARGGALADMLAEATNLQFEVGIVDSEQTLVELICAAPADTIGFLSAVGYVLAHARCEAQITAVAVHPDGLSWQTGMIVVRRDSDIESLADLAGKRWALADERSLASALYFQALLLDEGIAIGEVISVPGDSNAMLSVYNGESDLASATFVPPILPFNERAWQYGEDDPEVWRRLGISPQRSPIGYVLVNGEPEAGGYRLRDARAGVFDIVPEIYDDTRILTLSAPIPRETVAFGSAFPLGLARHVTGVLLGLSDSGACSDSLCAVDFYNWSGLAMADDSQYDSLRSVIESLELSESDLFALAP